MEEEGLLLVSEHKGKGVLANMIGFHETDLERV